MAPTDRDMVLSLNAYDDLDDAVAFTQLAEELGYGYVAMGETTGRHVPLILGLLAERTEEIGITDDVLSPYGRTPSTLGQAAVTLDEISGGRFRLRLGASSPALAERWHGVDFERPLRHVREAIEIVRQVQSGERLDYDGDFFSPDGLALECEPPEEPVPVDVAALGPKSVEMAGRFADGWVPQLLTVSALEERMEDLRRGADLGDRSAEDVRVALNFRCAALEDGDAARAHARQHVGFMIARYGPYYRQAIADAGWEDLVGTVTERWNDGDREGAVAAVSDELLDELVAAGTPEQAREQVRKFEAIDGLDVLQVSFFGSMDEEERRKTLRELAPGEVY
jgi:coenzyme F420-dependent oxidoreductase